MLLDTHTWIWLFNGSTELSQNTIKQIDIAGNQGKIFVSAISVWELSMLVAKIESSYPSQYSNGLKTVLASLELICWRNFQKLLSKVVFSLVNFMEIPQTELLLRVPEYII